jgi:hypothetical protein
MPFVHFPAYRRFAEWSSWGALRSPSQRDKEVPDNLFARLKSEHVFAYAGPCCFAEADDVGDIAAYFDPEVDQRIKGEASPFDSGALEGDNARLQDWAQKDEAERWKFLLRQTVPLDGWRARFEAWLLRCYDSPERYLETGENRYEAGVPDRTNPAALLVHNGPKGVDRYGVGHCADRRAWTWEARFAGELSFEAVRVLHLPPNRLQAAAEAVREQRFGAGVVPKLVALPPRADSSPDALYLHSRDAIEEFL